MRVLACLKSEELEHVVDLENLNMFNSDFQTITSILITKKHWGS